ncbi:MAG: M48 family metallopeptidase, partial [Clostridia bacterium]|nr:M48 family metallopeptidase [Clostridia bacterium]
MFKYEYRLKRSARRSVSVCVKDDNSITVNAPLGMPLKDIEKFLLSKIDWIELHMRRNGHKNAFLSEIIAYKKVLVAGKDVPLILGADNAFSGEEVRAKSVKNLKKLFVDNLGGQFLEMFGRIRAENDFICAKVE